MAVTRLERKGRKNKNVAKKRVAAIKRLNTVPTVKNVDLETVKKEFAEQSKNKTKSEKKADEVEAKVKEAPRATESKAKKETKAKAKKTTEKPEEGKKSPKKTT